MKIDLKQDLKRIEQDLAARVKNYGKSKKAILGKPGDPIRLITLGFGFDQSGWTVLVFDTRPDADLDGEWQSRIAGNDLSFDHWTSAFEDLCENETPLTITLHDGSRRTFKAGFEMEEVAECFGLMCKAALERAWKKKLFAALPVVEDCKLAVEDHDGNHGWKNFEREDEVDEDAVMDSLRARARKLSKPKRIEFWISELECLATERPCESAQLIWNDEFVVQELLSIGKDAVVPALKWVNRYAGKSEWRDPKKKREDEEWHTRSSDVCFKLFDELNEAGFASDEMEKLAQDYIRRAINVPPVSLPSMRLKRLTPRYSTVPRHVAEYLHDCYSGYPKPRIDPNNSRLLNADAFIGEVKKAPGRKRAT